MSKPVWRWVDESVVYAIHDEQLADRAGHEVEFVLEEAGKVVALEIKTASQVTSGDAIGIRAFRDDLKRRASFIRGAVLHAGKARPLDTDIVALPWGWMVPKS